MELCFGIVRLFKIYGGDDYWCNDCKLQTVMLGLSLWYAEEVRDQRERFRNATKFLNLVGYVSLRWWWSKFGIISGEFPFGQNIWDGMKGLLREWNAGHPTRAVQIDNWKLGWFYPPCEWSQSNARNRLSDNDVQAARRAYAYAYPTFFNQIITDPEEVEMKCVWILIVGMQRSWWGILSRIAVCVKSIQDWIARIWVDAIDIVPPRLCIF